MLPICKKRSCGITWPSMSPGSNIANITLLEFDEYGPVTYMFDLERSKVLLFGIRGTNSVFDLYLDTYAEALVIQLSTSLFPLYSSPFFKDLLNKFVGTSTILWRLCCF